jgi:DTW domain-containing protein YfiP
MKEVEKMEKPEKCPNCLKSIPLCMCAHIQPAQTKLQVLILQHPQEPDEALSSARLAHLALPNSTLKIGLSWPNLKAALGKEAIPSRWVVLYLGSGIQGEPTSSGLQFVSKKGAPIVSPPRAELDGIILLDGTWSQAKTLWWRNAWLLKVKRAILKPSQPSLYRELRKEPRKECLSTIETIAETLTSLGEPQTVSDSLKTLFSELLKKRRTQPKPGARPTAEEKN